MGMSEDVLFEMYRGDDHAFRMAIKDGTGTPIPVTGWSIKATMSLNPYAVNDADADVKVDMDNLSGDMAEAGVINVILPSEQTKNLHPSLYFFDIQYELSGKVKTIISGRVRVKADVTRRSGNE